MTGLTRPTGEQLRFRSQFTGDHVLDTYLEAAEKGGRRLDDLLDDLFDSNGVFRQSNFQFRYNPATNDLEYRIGQFVDPDASWNKITPLLQDAGLFSSLTAYENLQLVTDSVDDVYFVHGLSAPQTFADETAFRASANTTRLVNVSRAREWAIKVDGPVDGSDYSAKYNANLAAASATAASTSEASALAHRNTAETHKNAAQTAQTASEAARDLSQSYRDTAQSHKNAAEAAQTAAEAAQAAAESARQGAEDVFDSFDDRYLGSKTSDPALDNDGDALKPGALYWNSISSHLKFYNGTAWDVFGTGTMSVQSANNVAITGGTITGITDLALADGGTGASLSAPVADRIMFYDQSASSTSWLALASSLAITGTDLAVVPSQVNHDALQNYSANEHVDHTAVSILAGSGLSGGGTIASTRTLNVGQGTGITVSADAISTNDAQINHDALSNFVANEHIDHSAVSITAGSGLTGGGTIAATRTLNIGQGTGITVSADAISTNDAQINHDALSNFVADEHIAHSSVSITAGAGLTGGGTIASTRTLNIGQGTGIVVNANDVSVSSNLALLNSNPLTAAELQQLQNINTNTISNTQWSYLASANQAIATTSNVTFGQVTPTNGISSLARIFDTGASPNIDIDNLNASPSSHSLTFRVGATNTDRRFGLYADYAAGNFHLRTYNTTTGNFEGNPLTIAANAPSILSLNADGSAAFTGTVTLPSVNIDGGAIDDTPIGGTTPAAGSFTNGTFSGDVTIPNGHLGIGMTNPAYALDVAGDIRAQSGRLLADGSTLDGDATAPHIAFALDPDTGIFRPGTNAIAIATTGAERLRITNAGSLGLGTTNPGAHLHIQNDSALATLYVTSGTTGVSRIGLGDTASNTIGRIDYNNSINRLSLIANNAEGLAVRSDGLVEVPNGSLNVAIGRIIAGAVDTHKFGDGTDALTMSAAPCLAAQGASSSPGFVARRDGQAEIGMVASTYGQIGTWSNHRLAIMANAVEVATFLTNGNFGLGTTNPGRALHVYSTNANVIRCESNQTISRILFTNSATAETVSIGANQGELAMYTSSIKRLSISPAGVVNISNLPTSSAGLSSGDLWNDSGTLKVA